MWRKSSEAKATGASATPGPAQATPEEKAQANSQASKPSSAAAPQPASLTATTAKAPETAAAVATPAAPVKNAAPAAPTAAPVHDPAGPDSASTISAGLRIKGEITGTSDLTVDGETQGRIRLTNGRVTVGPKGIVNDIEAREIVVLGTVQGNLKASESVRLGPSSHVEGSVLTPRISIDDGARLRGNVEMARPGETAPGDKPETTKTPEAARAASASTSEE